MNTSHDITDNDLVLLYYGEHEDPALAARVARDPALSQRFEQLAAALRLTELIQVPARSEDYAARVWQAIAPRLEDRKATRPQRWWQSLAAPRFSLAGAFSLAAVAFLAFTLGRQGAVDPEAPVQQASSPAELVANLDPTRLLASSVSDHLDTVDLLLTQFANGATPAADEADWATDMLVANRLYRQAAAARGDQRLAQFLGDLEPLLIELAFEAQSASPETRARMQGEVRNGLLFRVRVMNRQLKQPGIST